MAVAAQESRGLSFAEQQLLRHGWEQGKGLGKNENGISEAIKVKVKCDKGGVGHKESEQFTFHWWDHVFNKASSSLAVESGQNGVVVKKVDEEEDEGTISNKKPRYAKLNKSALYGCFVKSATLLSGQEQPEPRSCSSDDSSSSDDDEKLDLSSTTKLSDQELMKACGGRTAHKGARHGLTMSAKLARLEQQEQEFMAKYSKKKQQTDKTTSLSESVPESSSALDQETMVKPKQKKHKKKKQHLGELLENDAQENDTKESPQVSRSETSKKQKKSSKRRTDTTDTPDVLDDTTDAVDGERKKKKKRKRLEKESEERVNESVNLALGEEPTETLEQCNEASLESIFKKDKKKKKKKRSEKMEGGLNENHVLTSEDSVDSKESHGLEPQEEDGAVLQPECNIVLKKKKKKSSKNKESCSTQSASSNVFDSSTVDLSVTAEDVETSGKRREKSKAKKRKRIEAEQQPLLMHVQKAVEWIQNNRHLFKGSVQEPDVLQYELADLQRALRALSEAEDTEMLIQAKEPFLFIFDFRDDMEVFINGCEKCKLRINCMFKEP